MWVLIDNHDSFTYILHHYLLLTGADCVVYKNDEVCVNFLKDLKPERIILSPGPKTPLEAGITLAVIEEFQSQVPLLGICLGHQAIGMHFGGRLIHATKPLHGKTSEISHSGHSLFSGISTVFTAMRYHSLVMDDLPTGLDCIAKSRDDNAIMSISTGDNMCIGVQFHPESIGTFYGQKMIENWAKMFS